MNLIIKANSIVKYVLRKMLGPTRLKKVKEGAVWGAGYSRDD